MAGLVQIAAVDPQLIDVGRLPHVAQLPLPRPGIASGVRAVAPHLAHAIGDLLGHQVHEPLVHRAVSGGVDNQVGGQHALTIELDAVRQDPGHLATVECHLAVDQELAGPYIDVVTRPAPEVLQEQSRPVLAKVQVKSDIAQLLVELGILLRHLVVDGNLRVRQQPIGPRGEQHVRLLGGHPVLQRLLRVEGSERQRHQGLAPGDVGGRALDHRHVRAVIPEGGADVVGGVVGADHDGPLALHVALAGELGRVPLLASKVLGPLEVRDVGVTGHPERKDELSGPELDLLAATVDLDAPRRGGLVELRAEALGPRPVVEVHDRGVVLEPVPDLVLRGEHRPVVRERDVGQVVVPDRIVQVQRLVPLAPGVSGALVLLDHDRGHAQPLEPGRESDPALAAADDHRVRLLGVAE